LRFVFGCGGLIMLLDVLLAIGLLLSTASQLRPEGAPIGPGEICLASWVFLMLCREARRLGPLLTRPFSILLIFWLIFAITQSLGTMTAFVIGDRHDPDLFLHDALAYPLLAAVSCLSVVEPGAGRRLNRVAWLLVTLGAPLLALQIGQAWGAIDILPIDPWYWDRFRGWSRNPNILALLCAVLGLLSLHLAETATRRRERIAAIACAILPIYVGRLTKSDTFAIILVASGPIFIALKFRTWLFAFQQRLTFRSAAAWIVVLAAPLAVAATAPLISSIEVEAKDVAKEMAKGNDAETERTASVRFTAWSEAISRGIESGMLGLGPGPHIPIPFLIVEGRRNATDEPKFMDHPTLGATPNFEAHNTWLDLFTQCGLIGVLSVIWLVTIALSVTYKAKLDGLVTLLCGLSIFSMFHLIIRHPIFWFAFALCLVAGDATRRTPPAARVWS
jgi:O-antigen ligase/polysaccharide polymerase Wzy-like membrane protein